jgi:ribosomal protein S18 acetylase RimI-like enzyme/ubiquinone/menaquinone biosynthesis C-methylase UbiE
MNSDVWRSPELSKIYLSGVRSAIPLASQQLETLVRLIAAVDIPIRRVLDLGCGDGVLAASIREKWPEVDLVLVDFSESMIAAARARFGNSARYVLRDFGDPSWTEALRDMGTFDAVVSGFSIHHQPDTVKRRIYSQILAVLQPGGIFLNLEHVSSSSPWGRHVADDCFIDSLWAFHQSSNPEVTRRSVADSFHHRPDKAANILAPVEHQCDWLRKLGFVDVDCYFKHFELALFGGKKPCLFNEPDRHRSLASPEIRQIRMEDVPSFREAVDSVARERRWLATVEGFGIEATIAFVRANLEAGYPQYVALENNSVVGWCDIVPVAPFPGFEHAGRLGIGILPNFRGMGLGRQLIHATLEAARIHGFRRVELEVYASNQTARKLYRRLGFEIEGVKKAVRILDGKSEDMISMAIQLEPRPESEQQPEGGEHCHQATLGS